jgi:chromosome segregation ATPase
VCLFSGKTRGEYNATDPAPERHAPPPKPLNVNPRRFIISAMSGENTQSLPDSRSFEERVFARFDAIDAGLRDLNTRVERLEARVERLETESERRAVETKPIWERALAEITSVREELASLSQKVDALDQKVHAIGRKLDVLASDMLDLRADQRRLEDRMDKLDSEHAR